MTLQGKRIAILVEDLYQDQEVWYPYYRLREAGVEVAFVGTGKHEYKGKYGYPLIAETTAEQVSASAFDGVIVPGGYAPDLLRRYPAVIRFVKEAHQQGKVIGAICHAGWVLCSAGIVRGKTVTCFSAIKDDVVNAGATYVDQEVVRDGNLITSRKPDDLPAFMRAILDALAEALPRPRRAPRHQAGSPKAGHPRVRHSASTPMVDAPGVPAAAGDGSTSHGRKPIAKAAIRR